LRRLDGLFVAGFADFADLDGVAARGFVIRVLAGGFRSPAAAAVTPAEPPSPSRLFFNVAIRSTTLQPRSDGAGSSSSMAIVALPPFLRFSAISFFSASV